MAPPPLPHSTHFTPTALEERQRLLAHHVRLVARGMSNGLAVYGSRGGLGKTKVVLDDAEGRRREAARVERPFHAASLYTQPLRTPRSVLFLDDCDSLFRNLPALGSCGGSVGGDNENRLVTYNCSQIKIPSSFYFTGRIIFAINTLPMKNHAFNAVLSRVDQYELTATNEEVLDLMRELAAQGFDGLTPDECMEVVDFIGEFSATRELSLRLLEPSFRKVLYARGEGVDWRQLVASPASRNRRTAVPKVSDCRTYDVGMPPPGRGGLSRQRGGSGSGISDDDPAFQGHVLPAEESVAARLDQWRRWEWPRVFRRSCIWRRNDPRIHPDMITARRRSRYSQTPLEARNREYETLRLPVSVRQRGRLLLASVRRPGRWRALLDWSGMEQ